MTVERDRVGTFFGHFPVVSLQNRQNLDSGRSHLVDKIVVTGKIVFPLFPGDGSEAEIGAHAGDPGFFASFDFHLKVGGFV